MKKLRKILAAILVVCICATFVPMQIFATGLTTEETTTTTTTTDENGNVVVTVTINKTTTGTDETGATVNREETRTDTTVSSEYGYEYGSTWTEGGSETKEWTEGVKPGDAVPEVEVTLKPGESTTGSATETTTGTQDGYNTTTTTDRVVDATTSDVKTSVNNPEDGLVGEKDVKLEGLYPIYDYVDGEKVDKAGMFDQNYLNFKPGYTDYENWDIPEGAEYRYVGVGEHSKYYIAHAVITYQKDEAGNTIFRDGKPVIESIKTASGTKILIDGKDPKGSTEIGDADLFSTYQGTRLTNFVLMDGNGNLVGAYCCDKGVSTVDGAWYSVANLDDSDYYASEEAEEHIRAIAYNGYWGTSNLPNEDGSYELGSLKSIKEKLKAAIENGEIPSEHVTYLYSECKEVCGATCTKKCGKLQRDADGNPITVTIDMTSVIDGLTEGEALLATQAAIWSYSNGCHDILSGKDGDIVIDPSSRGNFKGSNSDEPLDMNGNARVEFLYNWLIGLEMEEDAVNVINEKNFVEGMSLAVGNKVGETESGNGIYDTALNFKLAFIPGANDDLLVQISYTDLDGNPVTLIKRLAGENAEGQDYDAIQPDENGNYVISGLKLSENEDFNFDLRLEGTQYLEKDVYIYSALGGKDASQTFVGVAEGERNVDVSLGVTIRFEVDENKSIVAEREWYDEGDPVNIPPTTPPTTPPTNDNPPPVTNLYNIEEEEVPLASHLSVNNELVEILDEEVPLAAVPETGDHSVILIIAIIATAILFGATFIVDKKRAAIK